MNTPPEIGFAVAVRSGWDIAQDFDKDDSTAKIQPGRKISWHCPLLGA